MNELKIYEELQAAQQALRTARAAIRLIHDFTDAMDNDVHPAVTTPDWDRFDQQACELLKRFWSSSGRSLQDDIAQALREASR